jgi:hypothetical protein
MQRDISGVNELVPYTARDQHGITLFDRVFCSAADQDACTLGYECLVFPLVNMVLT